MPHIDFRYEFQTFCLDVAQRVLTRDGQAVSLTPKATEVLLILVQRAGQIVEKDVIINEVWPDSFVEEANLSQNIFLLRRALEDDGNNAKFIETVARRGYRFVAPVKKVEIPESPLDGTNGSLARVSVQPILAVMPFVNGTGNPELQYLAEGIPESIINSLSGLPQLRVISRSAAFRYRNREIDPQVVGRKLGAEVLLVGKISGRESRLSVAVELVNAATGWQLWGQRFKVETENIFDIQDQITTQISRALDLPLTREDEKRVAKRYTENAGAYQAYLEGRFHWSRYTRVGIEKAIGHFGRAIELDPNYALAYAGIVDCYLRLATNYLPPEDAEFSGEEDGDFDPDVETMRHAASTTRSNGGENSRVVAQDKVKLRHEWDWKGAERELRRANELKTDYPAAHQWHAAYVLSRDIYCECQAKQTGINPSSQTGGFFHESLKSTGPIASMRLTPSERIQVLCTVAREQIAVGNFDAGRKVLAPWLDPDYLSGLSHVSQASAADLLFTVGTLIGYLSSAGITARGQRQAEGILSGAVALFEHLGLPVRGAETRIELARCYYREGVFDMARAELERSLKCLKHDQNELRSLCLVVLAAVDRGAGRLWDSYTELSTALEIEEEGQLVTGRCQHELATTLQELASSECNESLAHRATQHFRRALRESEAIGNHRLAAASQNNLGYLLMMLGLTAEAEQHLLCARLRFERFHDAVRRAQVNETLARLYTSTKEYELALQCASDAVSVLEKTDEEALVSEALTTRGVILSRLNRFKESKKALADAYKVAERCGDEEGSASALLYLLEEICEELDEAERRNLSLDLIDLLATTRQTSLRNRFQKIRHHLKEAHSLDFD